MTTAKKTTTAKTTETLEAVAVEQQKKLEDAVKAGAEAFSQGYEQVYSTTKEQMDKVNEFAFKNYDELADLRIFHNEIVIPF